MQFLFERSDEMGDHRGLGVIPGCVTRFPENPAYKVPHMGWNQLQPQRPSPLFENVAENSYVYFVHGYYCIPTNEADILATVDYGFPFAAAIEHENVYGVQFHPEKSQRAGLQILRNFLEIPS
jgi:glutamine amidotransferase